MCYPVWAGNGTYVIAPSAAQAPATRADTTSWDPDGPPDPYVTVTRGTEMLGRSQAVSDTLTPIWSEVLMPAMIRGGDQLRLDLYDDDGGTDELMFSCTVGVEAFSSGTFEGVYTYVCRLGPEGDPEVRFKMTVQ